MPSLVTSQAQKDRLKDVVSWAMRLYGTRLTSHLCFVAELPEEIDYETMPAESGFNETLLRCYVPPVQRNESIIKIHPALCGDHVPRYVLRYVVVTAMIYSTRPGERLMAIKKRQAPYHKTAPQWLDRKGFQETAWDV